jgi:YidC/Oxa1 family membrane protein insertase
MFASIPIISPLFQALLNSIGWVLSGIYKYIPNYGVAIIILTVLLRLLVLPLGIKQIKSMGAMQAAAPRINEIKKKYKGNNQKIQEETMRLYKELGVNPLGGCLPLLLQFPILIAMYAVIRPPAMELTTYQSKTNSAYAVVNSHLPADQQLFINVLTHQDTTMFRGLNLQCSARDAGQPQVVIYDVHRNPVKAGFPIIREGSPVTSNGVQVKSEATYDCGSGGASKIPYFLLLLLMVGTTFYQQLQMQRVSPPGSASQQQQVLLRAMPLVFGFIGFSFPAALVLYWTVANLIQITQQWYLLRAGHIGPEAIERQIAAQKARQTDDGNQPQKRGWFSSMMERANEERQQRGQTGGRGTGSSGGSRSGSSSRGTGGRNSGNRNSGNKTSGNKNSARNSGSGGSANKGRGSSGNQNRNQGSKGQRSSGTTGNPKAKDPGRQPQNSDGRTDGQKPEGNKSGGGGASSHRPPSERRNPEEGDEGGA